LNYLLKLFKIIYRYGISKGRLLAESAIGIVDYTLTAKQAKGKDFYRSLYIVEEVKEGDLLTAQNVRSLRPGFRLYPKYYHQIIGTRDIKDFEKGNRLQMEP
jgi:pseudaminic acid synthase